MEQRIVALAAISSTLLALLFLNLKYTAGIVALTTPPPPPPLPFHARMVCGWACMCVRLARLACRISREVSLNQ